MAKHGLQKKQYSFRYRNHHRQITHTLICAQERSNQKRDEDGDVFHVKCDLQL